MPAILETKELKKYFPTPRGLLHAVDGVSFSITEGETLGVVGESGCGKSTLGRTLLNLLRPTGGQILFRGKDITYPNKNEIKEVRKNIQFIFQDPYSSLNPRMNVRQLIAEPLLISGIKKDRAIARVRELMDLVGLAERFETSYPHELDGGRRQRIGTARALSLNPKIIICDEPVSALDVSIQAQILNLFQDLQEKMGLTYIFITHNLAVVRHISDRIMVMYLGMVMEYAPKDILFEQPLHPYTIALLSAIPTTDLDDKKDRQILTGELASPINPKPGCRFAPRCIYSAEKCHNEQPQLMDRGGGHFVACNYSNFK